MGDTVVRAVLRGGRVQSKGDAEVNLNELPARYECTYWVEFNKESLVFGLLNTKMGEASRGNDHFLHISCGKFCCMIEFFDIWECVREVCV